MKNLASVPKAPCLHAFWKPLPPEAGGVPSGRFYLWMETPQKRFRAIQASKKSKKEAHPFSAGHAVLPGFFPEPFPWLEKAAYEQIRLQSLHSGETGGNWQVDALGFETSDVLDLLAQGNFNQSGMKASESLDFLREAAAWTLALLERGAFSPEFRRVEKEASVSLTAFWRLRFLDEEESRLEEFAKKIPAELAGNLSTAMNPAVFLRHFMESCADAWVRCHGGLNEELFFASWPEQWLQALGSVCGKGKSRRLISGPKTELEAFEKQLQAWLGIEGGKVFRTAFRLIEPAAHEGKWRLEFGLQSLDDRSLVIPASAVWLRDPAALSLMVRQGLRKPEEMLLADLARAAALFPPLALALGERSPSEALLSGRDAYLFLTQAAALFKTKGWGILVPDWWHQKKKRVSLRLRLKPPSKIQRDVSPKLFSEGGVSGLQALLDYDWEVLLGGEVMGLSEFEESVRLKTPFLKINGEWVELRLQEIDNLLRYFDAGLSSPEKKMSVGDALRLAMDGDVSETGLPVSEIRGEGWVESWLNQLTGGMEISAVEVPASFHGKLRPYQKRGLAWLAFLSSWGLGACLADDMGLGKTVELIALLLHLKEKEQGIRPPFLLVCPMSIVGNWKREIMRFAPGLKVFVHHGGERLSGEKFLEEAGKADVVITTYSLVYRDQSALAAADWGLLVLDEAQNIKNENALQTRAVKTFRARSRIALTGTPVENRLTELWSLFDFLNPGYLGSFESFRLKFQNPIEKRLDPERLDVLKRRMSPFILRRLKTDRSIIQDLPEKMEMKVYCNLTREQASLYQIVMEEMMTKIREATGIQRKGLVFSAITKLKQVCNHPAHYADDGSTLPGRSGKLNRLQEMLEEAVEEGGKALVFTQYVQMGHLIENFLRDTAGMPALFLHGGLAMKDRDDLVHKFQRDPKSPPVLILSVKAGGSGLNLTAANHVFHYDRWWNPAVEDQATDRAYRIGQTRDVQVHKLLSAGTLEEKIDLLIERKKALAEAVITTGEEFLTEISDEELREVLTLDSDAAAE